MGLRSFLVYTSIFLGFSSLLHSQVDGVGINTTDPRTTLEVAGTMDVIGGVNSFEVRVIDPVEEGETYAVLTQGADGVLKDMDINLDGAAFGYFQEYVITRSSKGNRNEIRNFNTNVKAADYRMVVMSAWFDTEVTMISDLKDHFELPTVTTFVEGTTWRIKANYPLAVSGDGTREWTILTMILPKRFSKDLGTREVDIEGENSGVSPSAIID